LPTAVLHESDFYRVERVDDPAHLRVVRKVRPFLSEVEVDQACIPVQQALDAQVRERTVLLIDTRIVAGRNDPNSERMFERHRREMILRFKRVALLVRTPAGLLHVQRLLASDRADARAFADEQEALAFLRGVEPPARVRR
jgi:hypothetical protein